MTVKMADSPTSGPRAGLRFAVATESSPAFWQARCVETLAAVPGVVIDRWIRVPARPAGGGTASGSRALAVVDAPEPLRILEADDPGGASGVDVLLDLSTGGAPPASWAAEVWRFRYGSRASDVAARAALVDYVMTPGRSRVALVGGDGAVLREGGLQWWRGEQLDRMLLDTSEWPAGVARRRIGGVPAEPANGAAAAPAAADPVPAGADPAPDAGRPTGIAGLPRPILEVAAVGRRIVSLASVMTRHEDWHIGLIDAAIDALVDPGTEPEIRWLAARPGTYAADPFGVERDGILHVFFEEWNKRAARGTISTFAIEPDGTIGDPEPILDPGVHCSYPFVIEHDGRTFLMPETAAARSLVLYEAIEFPRRWQPVATLLDGVPAVDASVVEHEGRWWMFATRADRGANHNLFIWHAPELTGPWTPHALNPVKTNSGSARPGGTPFVVDGRLYRPSQDDSRAYGGRLVLSHVEVLEPDAFAERAVRTIDPRPNSPYPDGIHTLSRAGSAHPDRRESNALRPGLVRP